MVALLPDGPGQRAGLAVGDVVTALGAVAVRSAAEAGRALGLAVGKVIAWEAVRAGASVRGALEPAPRPREAHPGLRVEYGSVTVDGARLRTVFTGPERATGPVPAVLFLQGHTAASVDLAVGGNAFLRELVRALGRAGVGVLRVEKRGVGDSEGDDPGATTLAQESEGYAAALESLRARDAVDPQRVSLFGHSLGGLHAMALAAERPWAAGVVAAGTGIKTWTEYLDGNLRRHREASFADAADTEDLVRLQQRLCAAVLVQGRPLRGVLAGDAAVARRAGDLGISDDGRWYGHEAEYWQAVYDARSTEHLRDLRCGLLAFWGSRDLSSEADDHLLLVAIANRYRPESATFVEVDGADHELLRATGEPDPRVPDTVARWVLAREPR